MNARLPAVLAVWAVVIVCGGCGAPLGGPAKEAPRLVGATDVGERILSARLDELTDQAEQLPKDVTAERQATPAAFAGGKRGSSTRCQSRS